MEHRANFNHVTIVGGKRRIVPPGGEIAMSSEDADRVNRNLPSGRPALVPNDVNPANVTAAAEAAKSSDPVQALRDLGFDAEANVLEKQLAGDADADVPKVRNPRQRKPAAKKAPAKKAPEDPPSASPAASKE